MAVPQWKNAGGQHGWPMVGVSWPSGRHGMDKPWCDTGRALGREAGPASGNRARLLGLVVVSSKTAAPDRDTSRSWHPSVLFLLRHSAKEGCNFLESY